MQPRGPSLHGPGASSCQDIGVHPRCRNRRLPFRGSDAGLASCAWRTRLLRLTGTRGFYYGQTPESLTCKSRSMRVMPPVTVTRHRRKQHTHGCAATEHE
jgi:hypothetical protein